MKTKTHLYRRRILLTAVASFVIGALSMRIVCSKQIRKANTELQAGIKMKKDALYSLLKYEWAYNELQESIKTIIGDTL